MGIKIEKETESDIGSKTGIEIEIEIVINYRINAGGGEFMNFRLKNF